VQTLSSVTGATLNVIARQPAQIWYLPEGYTGNNWATSILLQNPNNSTANVTVIYQVQGGTNVARTFQIDPNKRFTIQVHDSNDPNGLGPNKAFATYIASDQFIVIEHALYWNNFTGATDSVGVTLDSGSPNTSTTWYLAEGYTGSNFATSILLQNPNNAQAHVTVEYQIQGGSNVTRNLTIDPNKRFTIQVQDAGDPNGLGPGFAFATKITSDVGIVAERAMYWNNFTAGHDSIGASQPKTTWYLPEGYTGSNFATSILLQNPNNAQAHVTVEYQIQGGSNVTRNLTIDPNKRFTIQVQDAGDPNGLGPGFAFATKITSDVGIVAEHAIYLPNYVEGTDSIGYAP